MSKTRTKEWGAHLPDHTPALINDLKSARAKASVNAVVRVVALPGTWLIWSPGPSSSSWLKPANADAIAAERQIADDPAGHAPVVHQHAQSMIAVPNTYLRPTYPGRPAA